MFDLYLNPFLQRVILIRLVTATASIAVDVIASDVTARNVKLGANLRYHYRLRWHGYGPVLGFLNGGRLLVLDVSAIR